MKNINIILALVILLGSPVRSQALNILENDGSNTSYGLTGLDSISFTSIDSAGSILMIHAQSGTSGIYTSDIDSIYFNSDGSTAYFQTSTELKQFVTSSIDSITVTATSDSTVYVMFNGSTASVINPLDSVSVEINGADVTVNSTSDISGINYILSGSTTDGMFKIYSEKKLTLILNNVKITNNDGPAINIQSGKKITINLAGGTENILTDGETYADAENDEDQGAAFFSEGQLIFKGNGSLEINGNGDDQHGLRSDDYIEVDEGTLVINSAVKDGIHAKDGFYMYGGNVEVTSSGDGIDGDGGTVEIEDGNITIHNEEPDQKAIACDSTITVSGGSITINVDGDQSSGIDSDQDIIFSGGSINITTTGDAVLEASGAGYDPSYCTAVKSGGNISISNCDITINTSGDAGRGFSLDGDLNIGSGTVKVTSGGNGAKYTDENGTADAYTGPCIKVDGNFNFTGGSVTLSHSGAGGKGLSVDGELNIGTVDSEPELNITTTGSEITISSGSSGPRGGETGEAAEAKAVKADGAVVIENGNITISSADDGIKSETSVTINGGTLKVVKSYESVEAPFITVNGGDINLVSSDDSFNSTYGNGGEQDDGSMLAFNGGYVCASSTAGDPLDSNGDISMTGGTVIVHGPQSSVEVGIDYNGTFNISGGFLAVSGTSSNMTQGLSGSSTQYSLLVKSSQGLQAGSLFHIEDSNGNNLLTFAPARTYYSIVFSSQELKNGSSYKIYIGGSSTGTPVNGLYTDGTYSGGTLRKTVTITTMAQTVQF